jgi:hypothetical protein
MKRYVLALAAVVAAALGARAAAAPLVVVVREAPGDALAVARLRGQLADLDVALRFAPGPIEPGLSAQLATAARLAALHGARAVVWFVARDPGLAVAIATPGDRRLFVREIPPADPSAVAEAAAVAARGALRAIGDGGTIGIELARPEPAAPAAPPTPAEPAARTELELALGWQVALDAGADAGAHALAQRTSAVRGGWAGSLVLSLGPALRHRSGSPAGAAASPGTAPGTAPAIAIDLSRTTAALAIERRIAGFAIAATAGAALYHRTTVATPGDLIATPAVFTAALVAGPELRWQWRPRGGPVAIAAAVGADVVVGAPELAVARSGAVDSLGRLRTVQPRFTLSLVAELP